MSKYTGRDRIHFQGSMFINSWKLDVCHGVHKTSIAHEVGFVSRYMNNPSKEHWKAVQWILRYLRGATSHSLCFGGLEIILQRYIDADMAGEKDRKRSTTGYVFTIGGTMVSWISKLQKVVSLLTMEVEYVVVIEANK